MAKTKREYILATCFLSGAAAIISFVALGTQEWVTSETIAEDINNTVSSTGSDNMKFGLFSGVFRQETAVDATIELTMVCLLDRNICALLCGDNMEVNLERLYKNQEVPTSDREKCATVTSDRAGFLMYSNILSYRVGEEVKERTFINSGVWVSTIFFLCLSAVMGLISAGLAVWNTASNPYQAYFSVFGLYIYNAIAFFCILLTVILWGVMYSSTLVDNDIPTYKTFLEKFHTKGYAHLGYSYWINLVSLFLYIASICVLYVRDYLISKEPEVKVHIEDNTDPQSLQTMIRHENNAE